MLLALEDREDRYQQTKNRWLIVSLPACLCLITMINAAFHYHHYESPLPQFTALVYSNAPTTRGTTPKIRTYRVVRILPGRERCIAITADGSRFTVIGNAMDRMKPGLVFQAQIVAGSLRPVLHPNQHTAWLIEPTR